MKISYDAEVDALSITFRETTVTTRHLTEGISADHEKTVIQRQIDATDRQIDQLVHELYGLTEEEIKIVGAGLKPAPTPTTTTI